MNSRELCGSTLGWWLLAAWDACWLLVGPMIGQTFGPTVYEKVAIRSANFRAWPGFSAISAEEYVHEFH